MTLTQRITKGYRELAMSEDANGNTIENGDIGFVHIDDIKRITCNTVNGLPKEWAGWANVDRLQRLMAAIDVEGEEIREGDTGLVRVRIVQTGLLRAKNVLVRPIDKDGETDVDAAVFVVPGRYVKKQEQ